MEKDQHLRILRILYCPNTHFHTNWTNFLGVLWTFIFNSRFIKYMYLVTIKNIPNTFAGETLKQNVYKLNTGKKSIKHKKKIFFLTFPNVFALFWTYGVVLPCFAPHPHYIQHSRYYKCKLFFSYSEIYQRLW